MLEDKLFGYSDLGGMTIKMKDKEMMVTMKEFIM